MLAAVRYVARRDRAPGQPVRSVGGSSRRSDVPVRHANAANPRSNRGLRRDLILAMWIIGSLHACKDRPPACIPGVSASCPCASGPAGAQVCQSDGTFGTCVCQAAVQLASPVIPPPTPSPSPPAPQVDVPSVIATLNAGVNDAHRATQRRLEQGETFGGSEGVPCVEAIRNVRRRAVGDVSRSLPDAVAALQSSDISTACGPLRVLRGALASVVPVEGSRGGHDARQRAEGLRGVSVLSTPGFAGRIGCPSMEGDVKTHFADPPGHAVLASGVHLRSRHAGPGDRSPDRTVPVEVAGDSSRRSVLRDSVVDHHSLDFKAVSFSRKCGNHPSIRASKCHGFIRFSGGA